MTESVSQTSEGSEMVSLKRSLSSEEDSSSSPKNKVLKLEEELPNEECTSSPKAEDNNISLLNKLLDEVTTAVAQSSYDAIATHVKKDETDKVDPEPETCTVVDVNNKDEINALSDVTLESHEDDKPSESHIKAVDEEVNADSSKLSLDTDTTNNSTIKDGKTCQNIPNTKNTSEAPKVGDNVVPSPTSDLQSSDKNEKKELNLFVQCGICREHFSNRTPLMLGCLHIFCSK